GDPPQEVRLVLPGIAAAIQGAVPGDRVVPGGDVGAVEGVGMVHEVAKLRERIAAHARNRRAAACILGNEVRDYVAAEPILEVENVVRDAEPGGGQLGGGDGSQGAAGA